MNFLHGQLKGKKLDAQKMAVVLIAVQRWSDCAHPQCSNSGFQRTDRNLKLTNDFGKYLEAPHGCLWVWPQGPQTESRTVQVAGRQQIAPRRLSKARSARPLGLIKGWHRNRAHRLPRKGTSFSPRLQGAPIWRRLGNHHAINPPDLCRVPIWRHPPLFHMQRHCKRSALLATGRQGLCRGQILPLPPLLQDFVHQPVRAALRP